MKPPFSAKTMCPIGLDASIIHVITTAINSAATSMVSLYLQGVYPNSLEVYIL
jgi:hypothetical protein